MFLRSAFEHNLNSALYKYVLLLLFVYYIGNRSIRLRKRLVGTSAAKLWNEPQRNIKGAHSITMLKNKIYVYLIRV